MSRYKLKDSVPGDAVRIFIVLSCSAFSRRLYIRFKRRKSQVEIFLEVRARHRIDNRILLLFFFFIHSCLWFSYVRHKFVQKEST